MKNAQVPADQQIIQKERKKKNNRFAYKFNSFCFSPEKCDAFG